MGKAQRSKFRSKLMVMSYVLTEKKKDDLQSVIQLIESSNIGIPIQFINFRD